jgi:hypothetical protein
LQCARGQLAAGTAGALGELTHIRRDIHHSQCQKPEPVGASGS